MGRKLEQEGGETTGTRSTQLTFPKTLVEKGGRNRSDGISSVRRDGCRRLGRELKETGLGFLKRLPWHHHASHTHTHSMELP